MGRQRTLLIALVVAVAAAAAGAIGTIVLTADDTGSPAAAASPSASAPAPSAAVTADVQTASPSAGATDRSPDTPTTASPPPPSSDPGSSPTPKVTIRSAKSVDCDDEPAFCSSTDGMVVADGRTLTSFNEASDQKRTTRPTISMDSAALDADKETVGEGATISSIHVEVVVSNTSKETFRFARREIVLDVFRNGERYDSFATEGSGFDLTPGSNMTGTFDRPITDEGTYSWRARVWYYEVGSG